jgi:hypothetical protein
VTDGGWLPAAEKESRISPFKSALPRPDGFSPGPPQFLPFQGLRMDDLGKIDLNASAGPGLSKSLLLKGMQCPKALYLSKHPPAFHLPLQPDREARYQIGTEVGLLARSLFPGGVEVPYAGLAVSDQVARTRELIEAGEPVIYEASFAWDGIFVKVDILVRVGSIWEIHEVKMATSVKDINLDDVAIQYFVLSRSGLSVSRTLLVHIDNRYVRQGDLDVHRLFAGEEVTEAVLARQGGLPERIERLRATLTEGHEPAIDIGPWCTDPYECDFIPYCWRHIPDESIFSLSGSAADKFALYYAGFVRLGEVPLDRLKGRQRFEAEATLGRQDTIHPERIRDFLDSLWYPLCHLDFETFDTPIPPFDGVRPYQKIPFQYSLYFQPQEGVQAEHREFLAMPGSDPRRELAERLLAEIPEGACVLTYNQAFEKGVLRELAAAFPDLAPAIEARLAGVRDLMLPFKRRDVYCWPMQGSYSIKKVLPALVPDLSYEGLSVADGQMAMLAWHEMGAADDPERVTEIRRALLEYCRLDTLAMVRILEELKKMS